MALSRLQVSVLRAVAAGDRVAVSALVANQGQAGARRSVARAALSRSLRRLWRLGAVELYGRCTSLNLGQSTALLGARAERCRWANRLMRWHLCAGSLPSGEPIPARVYVRAVAITSVGRDLLNASDRGLFPVWRQR